MAGTKWRMVSLVLSARCFLENKISGPESSDLVQVGAFLHCCLNLVYIVIRMKFSHRVSGFVESRWAAGQEETAALEETILV